MISTNIEKYISNTKINGKFAKWRKNNISVFISPIRSNIAYKDYYYEEINRAIQVWNKYLKENYINIQFEKTTTPNNADIIINWTKVGRVFEGMCKYPSIINSEIRKILIEIGLPNEFSGKNTTNESIFFTIMHELGHSLGLGHGIEIDDLMFVPHKKNISVPSENDIYVLQQIYK